MERTGNLSDALGVSLRSLAPRLGLSVASLFGYRSGKIPISAKAWSKLERVESEVQRRHKPATFAGNNGNLKDPPGQKWDEGSTILRDDVAVYRAKSKVPSEPEPTLAEVFALLREALDKLEIIARKGGDL